MVYTKKKQDCSEVSHTCLQQAVALGPLRGLQLPPDPQIELFLALPKTNLPVFFLYYPLCTNTYHDVTDLVNDGMVKNTKS